MTKNKTERKQITMNIIRYIPHELKTRFYACLTYSNRKVNHYTLKDVLRLYHISKAFLMRWMKRFDGTIESLMDKPKRPKTPHPNAHTANSSLVILSLLSIKLNILCSCSVKWTFIWTFKWTFVQINVYNFVQIQISYFV